MKKMNNKGFSLVELIIVIAIMAILAAALAPQLIKYLEKSRESTDASTCDTIKSAFNAAVTNEAAYNEMMTATTKTINITFSGNTASYDNQTACGNVVKELQESLAQIKAPKATGKSSYEITWTVSQSGGGGNTLKNVNVVTK